MRRPEHRNISLLMHAGRPIKALDASGTHVVDEEGREYLDLTGDFGRLTTGYCHPAVQKSVMSLLKRGLFSAAADIYTQSSIELAEKLAILVPGAANRRVALLESSFLAKNLAARVPSLLGKNGDVIALGRAGAGLCDEERLRKIDFPGENPGAILEHIFDNCEGGEISALYFRPQDFILPGARTLTKKLESCAGERGTLLIVDETGVQPGITGNPFLQEELGIIGDITILGEGIASGLPMGAIVLRPSLDNELDVVDYARPAPILSVQAALTTIRLLEEELLDRVRELEPLLAERTREIENVLGDKGHIVRRGLFLRLAFREREIAGYVHDKMLSRGIIVDNREKEAIYLTPSLIIRKRDIKRAFAVLREVLEEILS